MKVVLKIIKLLHTITRVVIIVEVVSHLKIDLLYYFTSFVMFSFNDPFLNFSLFHALFCHREDHVEGRQHHLAAECVELE